MDNNQGPLSWLKKWFNKEDKPDKKTGKYQYMIIVLCLGAAFMLVSNLLFKNSSAPTGVPVTKNSSQTPSDVPVFGQNKSTDNQVMTNYEKTYEDQLKKTLEQMLGVNDVTVMVTIDSTDQKILEKNKSIKTQTTDETDTNGGKRTVQDSSTDEQLVIVKNGDQEVPIVTETKKPDVRGVVVVASGAENIQVKKLIVEAVTKALGVPSYKVAVMPKNK